MCILSTRTVTNPTKSHLIFFSQCLYCGCRDRKPGWLFLVLAALWTEIRRDPSYSHDVFRGGVLQMRKVNRLELKGMCKSEHDFTVRKSATKRSITSGFGFSDYSHYTIAFGIKCIYNQMSDCGTPLLIRVLYTQEYTALFLPGLLLGFMNSYVPSHLVSIRGESIFCSALPISWWRGNSLEKSEMHIQAKITLISLSCTTWVNVQLKRILS